MAEERNIKINIDSNAKEVARDTNALGTSIEKATNSTAENNQEVAKGNESYKTFKTQLREANAELQKQIQLTGESSKETIKAAKSVADLKDQMGFAKDLSDNFNPDQKFKALGAATQVAGTGLQGVTAGMALFGGESADTQKQLLKVQAAMAFSDAISGLSNLGDQWKLLKVSIASSTIITKANTAATGAAAIVQNAFTGSVVTTSVGFKALKLAIAGLGIGLLIVGVATLVTNFDKVSSAILKVAPGLANVGKFIGSIVNSITDFIGVTSEADRIIDRMKANADSSIALNKKFLAEHGSQLDEFTKQKIEAKNKYNEAIKEDGADQIALAKELNRELAAIEYSRGDEQRKIQADNAQKSKDEAEKRRQKEKDEELKKKEKEKEEAKELAISQKESDEETEEELKAVSEKKHEETQQTKQEQDEENARNQIANWEYLYDTQKDIEEKTVKNKKENQDKIVSQGESLLGNIKNLAGKNKALQKASIIAEGGIALGKSVANTAEAVTKDLAKGAPFSAPLVALDIAVGATSAASIIKGTADSLKAIGSGGSISGGGGASIPAIPQATPQVAFNNTAENQIGRSISQAQTEQPPIKVYVAESDVTEAQTNVKVLVEKNTL